ncbi:hypothetical protein L6164_000856 [Bauhinia variegata]|uniref:Uncharacterized protein n=1 Tax=Bauhinia variegata TaxID=167791 RepID=A0ACB9QDU6_BAUVA|nr:hypothetical protein L6164_000856 [Bauhinia variegata]
MDMKAARKTERFSGETCAHWLAGRCNRNHCRFLHKETPLPSPEYHDAAGTHLYARQSHSFSENPPKYNSKKVSIKKIGGGGTNKAKNTQKSSRSICRYWMNSNCVRGDQCWNLHSWFDGDDGLSTLAKLQEHKKAITGITLPVGSDKLYSGSSDGTVRMWDCNTGKCANVIKLGAEVGCLISEGPWVFVGVPNAVKAWNTQTAAEFVLNGPRGQVFAMIVANDTLFAGAQDGIISAWRGSFGTECPFELVASLSGHTRAVVCLAVGGKMLFSGSTDHSIKVWDVDTLQCTMTLNGHTDVVMSLICWDHFLLSCSLDGTVKVWVATEQGSLKVTYTHNEEHGVLALCGMTDADAKPILFCSCNDNIVRAYDLPSFSQRVRLFAKKEVREIEIGPGGLFFTGDGSGLLMVWKWLAEPKMASS